MSALASRVPSLPAPRQERLTVIEPIQGKGSTIAWARLTFVRSMQPATMRTPQERLEQVARLLVPVFLFLVTAIGIAMRLATARMQQRIQSVVTEAMSTSAATQGDEMAFEPDAAMTDAGSRRAA